MRQPTAPTCWRSIRCPASRPRVCFRKPPSTPGSTSALWWIAWCAAPPPAIAPRLRRFHHGSGLELELALFASNGSGFSVTRRSEEAKKKVVLFPSLYSAAHFSNRAERPENLFASSLLRVTLIQQRAMRNWRAESSAPPCLRGESL